MFTLKVENNKHQFILLTQQENDYQIINIEGLDPPEAEIYTNPVANMNGAKFKSSKLQMRNIVLLIKINGNVEENRINLYKYFATGNWNKLYYTNGSREVFIEGYCENINTDLFTINQEMQISIVCPNPYLKSVDAIKADNSKVVNGFSFPFAIAEAGVSISQFEADKVVTIINDGEFETGLIIKLHANANGIVNPAIYNADTGEYMYIETTLNYDDEIIINTNKGQKSITKIVNNEETNIINALSGSSTWLQLQSGINNFTYEADLFDNLLNVVFEYNYQYEGV